MNDVIEAIRVLLLTEFGSTYTSYQYGEVKVPIQKMFPFIEVIPATSLVENRGTGGMLDNNFEIQINLKNTLKKYLNKTGTPAPMEHIRDLVKKMEERNADGTVKSNTILGVLHDNLQLSSTACINGDWNIIYDDIDLGESYITFASISFSVKLITT